MLIVEACVSTSTVDIILMTRIMLIILLVGMLVNGVLATIKVPAIPFDCGTWGTWLFWGHPSPSVGRYVLWYLLVMMAHCCVCV